MKQPNVTVYGSRACEDTKRATDWLASRQVPYEFKDVDEFPEYNSYVASLNGGKRVIPTIRIDNETLINPADQDLERALTATPGR